MYWFIMRSEKKREEKRREKRRKRTYFKGSA